MSLRVGWKYRFMFLMTVLLVGAFIFIRYSDAFLLANIETAPEGLLDNADLRYVTVGQNMLDIPGSDIVDYIVGSRKAIKADLNYKLPNGIEIKLNDYKPLALVCFGNTTLTLSENGYLNNFDFQSTAFNFPVITGAQNCIAYFPVIDNQLCLLVEQLKSLRQKDNDFYLALSSMDLSNQEFITIQMDGIKPQLKMYAGDLVRNMEYLKTFLLEFNPDLSEIDSLDFRLKGQIIATKKDDGNKNNNGD